MTNIISLINQNESIQKIKNIGSKLNIPMIHDEGLAFMVSLLSSKKDLKILEIGTAIGYSAIALSLLTDAEIWTIERNKDLYDVAIDNINTISLSHKIHLILGDAFDINMDSNSHFDVIFIDAAKAQYQRFFTKFEPLLSDDGIIVTDNLSFHGIVQNKKDNLTRNQRAIARKIQGFIDWLKTLDNFQTDFYDVGDGMSVSRHKRG